MTNLENKVNEKEETKTPSLEKKDFIPVYGLFRLAVSGRYDVGKHGVHKDYFSHVIILSVYNTFILLGAVDLYKYLTNT